MQAELEGFVTQAIARGLVEIQWSEFRDRHFSQVDDQFAKETALRWFAERGIHATIDAHHLGWRDVEVLVLKPLAA